MNIPDIIYAGDDLEWVESAPTDDADNSLKASLGWTFKYNIINSTGKAQISAADISSSAYQTDDHKFSLTSAQTAGWTAGKYLATGYCVKGTEYQIIGRKTIEIKLNVLTATTHDFRTHAHKSLEAIEAAIERRASKEQLQLSISTGGGSSRAVQFMTLEELIKARAYYKAEVDQEIAKEKIDNGQAPGGRVKLQFS